MSSLVRPTGFYLLVLFGSSIQLFVLFNPYLFISFLYFDLYALSYVALIC